MAFKIIPKIKADQIQDRSLDTGFLSKYYKQVQTLLLQKTTAEEPTDYFFCEDFANGENLLVVGTQTMAFKKVFRAAAKGEDGFDRAKISMGTCFVLDEKESKILCIQANTARSKGKRQPIIKALKKIRRTSMKKFDDVRWLDGPVMVDAADESKVEVVNDDATLNPIAKQTTTKETAPKPEAAVGKEEIVKRIKDLQKAIGMLQNDILPRHKKQESTDRDVAFVQALRKAGHLFLSKLEQADDKVIKKFASQKEQLEKGLPLWKELESKIQDKKTKVETTAATQKVINKMNSTRQQIQELLTKVNLKAS